MDEQLILTGLPLRLNPALQRSVPSKGISVLGHASGGGQPLTLTDRQYEVLRAFLNPTTVPDVVRVLILRRACIPLREFYELVLKSFRAGILITDIVEPPLPGRRWAWFRLPEVIFPLPAWSAATVALLWLTLHGLPLSLPVDWRAEWPAWVGGWFLVIAALMAGDALAAGVLTRLRGSAPAPHFHGLSFFPRWAVSMNESVTLTPSERVGLASARLFPLATLCVVLVAFFQSPDPGWSLVPFIALLFQVRPFGTGCLMPVLAALFRSEILDTHRNLVFSLNQRWWLRVRFGLEGVRLVYIGVRLVVASAWVLLLVGLSLRLAGSSIREVYGDPVYWAQVAKLFGLYLAVVFLIFLLPPSLRRARSLLRRRWHAVVRLYRYWFVSVARVSSHDAVLKRMAASPGFRRLSATHRLALVAAGEVRRLPAYKRYGAEPSVLPVGLLLSGRVAVYRVLPSGRSQKVAIYLEGDVVGAEAWADPEGGAVQIETLVPVVLLEWTPEVFGQRVISELGAALACDLFVKVPFLRQLDLCRGWHAQALARFAQIARFTTFEQGHPVLAEGEAVLWFFLLYSGGASTRKKNGSRAWLRAGDFFGEISLMRQDVATADVLTEGVTRCLLIHRPEFLRFMAHNPIAALEVEAVSSRRFGRPVFPYQK